MEGSVRLEYSVAGLERQLASRGIRVTADGAATFAESSDACISNLRSLRELGPIILSVASRDQIAVALDAGADDVVLRSASADEIAARIAARIRLIAPPLRVGDLLIDRVTRKVSRAGRVIALFPREYALLLHLAKHAGEPVPRRELLLAVWSLKFDPGTNVVAVHMSRLRAKLDRGFTKPLLRTAKGIGYMLIAD